MQEEYLIKIEYDVGLLEVEGVKHKVNKRQAIVLEEIEGGCEDETL